jgi:uncharacterized protein YuzE
MYPTSPMGGILIDPAPQKIIGTSDDDIVVSLSRHQETDLKISNITIYNDRYHLCIFESRDFSKAFVNCPEGCIIGEGTSKFYVLKPTDKCKHM